MGGVSVEVSEDVVDRPVGSAFVVDSVDSFVVAELVVGSVEDVDAGVELVVLAVGASIEAPSAVRACGDEGDMASESTQGMSSAENAVVS